jgi:hypothetical protein
VEFPLGIVVREACSAFLEPLADRFFEERRNGNFAMTGFALEMRFEVAGDAPAVDLSLQAPQRSAFVGLFPASMLGARLFSEIAGSRVRFELSMFEAKLESR